jgi:GxxExxY protein
MSLLHEQETFAIRGAIFEVYREMGPGFLEAVYQECLEKEFTLRGIHFAAEVELPLQYKGQSLSKTYRADLICFGNIIIEIKGVKKLLPEHTAQTLNYLNATGLKLGLLVNFGSPGQVEIERIIL